MKKISIFIALFSLPPIYSYANYVPTVGTPHISGSAYVETYAHRGNRAFSPESTIPSYATGLAVGTNWVDCDISITKDGVIIVDHDAWLNPDIVSIHGVFWASSKGEFVKTLSTLPGGFQQNIQPYLVKNLTLSQIQSYEAGIINPTSPYAAFFPDQHATPNSHIPTLQEVVNYVNSTTNGRVNFQIEIKNDPLNPTFTASPLEFATKLNQFIVQNSLQNRVEIQSFDWEPLYILHQLNPNLKLAFLVGYDDIERMYGADPTQAGLWSGGKLVKNYNYSLPQMVKALGGSCYEPEDVTLTKEQVDECHTLGLKVVVWRWPEHSGSAFDTAMINKLIDWGVDGIIIDDPGKLNSILASRGMTTPIAYPLSIQKN